MENRVEYLSSKAWADNMIKEFLKSDDSVLDDFVYKHCEWFFEDSLRSVEYDEELGKFRITIKR